MSYAVRWILRWIFLGFSFLHHICCMLFIIPHRLKSLSLFSLLNPWLCSAHQGKVPLLSLEAIHQLHIFIFVLAVTHVVLSLTTVVLGGAKVILQHDLVLHGLGKMQERFHCWLCFLDYLDPSMETLGGCNSKRRYQYRYKSWLYFSLSRKSF